MKKLSKIETKKALKILSDRIKYKLEDNTRYLASSNLGNILISFDLNCEIPTIYCRYENYSKILDLQKCISRGFGETSGKRNYHVFTKDINMLIDTFSDDIILDEIQILEKLGGR